MPTCSRGETDRDSELENDRCGAHDRQAAASRNCPGRVSTVPLSTQMRWNVPNPAAPGKAQALRRAQLTLLHDLRSGRVSVQTKSGTATLAEHPILWASFILVGKP